MKYIKTFENHTAYEQAKTLQDPNNDPAENSRWRVELSSARFLFSLTCIFLFVFYLFATEKAGCFWVCRNIKPLSQQPRTKTRNFIVTIENHRNFASENLNNN
jgi:hypothetical protein